MKYVLFAFSVVIAMHTSCAEARADFTPLPFAVEVPLSHTGNLSMDFLSGRWVGQQGSLRIEESWTPEKDGKWFGIRKIDDGGNVEFQVFTFHYSNVYLSGEVRVLTEDLNEPANKISRFHLRVNDFNKKGTALLRLSDTSNLSYVAIDPSTVTLTTTDKGSIQKIELKKQ